MFTGVRAYARQAEQNAGDPDFQPQLSPLGTRYLDSPNPEESRWFGYAPPRAVEVILAGLRQLKEPIRPPEGSNSAVMNRYVQDRYQFHFHRANLATELQRAGYKFDQDDEILILKVESLSLVHQAYTNFLAPTSSRRLWEITQEFPDSKAADLAMYKRMQNALLQPFFRVKVSEMQRIADVELKLPAGEEYAGVVMLSAMRGWTDDEMRPWKDWILENLPEDSYGVRKIQVERNVLGLPVRIQGVGLDGEQIDTSKWLGKTTVVYFWGMWCGPCVSSTPYLKKISDSFDIQLVGVYCGVSPETGRQYLLDHGLDFPQIPSDLIKESTDVSRHPIAREFAVIDFPTYLVIDENGVLVFRTNNTLKLEQHLEAAQSD